LVEEPPPPVDDDPPPLEDDPLLPVEDDPLLVLGVLVLAAGVELVELSLEAAGLLSVELAGASLFSGFVDE